MQIDDIPVLFIPFARMEYARLTFDAIRGVQPKKLYFYCDRAREEESMKAEGNKMVRSLVDEIDWDCKLKIWFRNENMGAYVSMMDAIDWIFENEEEAIILEEDCVPSTAFFDYCRQLLPRYKSECHIWFLSGNNFIEKYNPSGYDYIFSSVIYQWGWATWKDRWQKVIRTGFKVLDLIDYKLHLQYYATRNIARYTENQLIRKQNEQGFWLPDSWDYMFQMSMRMHGGIGIIPIKNLVSNVGIKGTNSIVTDKRIHNLPTEEGDCYKIERHPPFLVSDIRYTRRFFNSVIQKRIPFWKRLIRK